MESMVVYGSDSSDFVETGMEFSSFCYCHFGPWKCKKAYKAT